MNYSKIKTQQVNTIDSVHMYRIFKCFSFMFQMYRIFSLTIELHVRTCLECFPSGKHSQAIVFGVVFHRANETTTGPPSGSPRRKISFPRRPLYTFKFK